MSVKDVFSYVAFVNAVAGVVGGQVTTLVFYPLDQIRALKAIQQGKEKKSTINTITEYINEEGISGLYKGLESYLVSLAISNFIYFYTYNLLKVLHKKLTKDASISVVQNLVIGSLAGAINVVLTCPLWAANHRLKFQRGKSSGDGKKPYNGLFDAVFRIANEQGVAELWSSVYSSLILVSNPTIQWAIYEKIKQYRSGGQVRKSESALDAFINAAFSKSLSTVITYPIQVAQTRQRVGHGGGKRDSSKDHSSTFWVLLEIFKSDGILGWYAGMDVKLIQTVLASAFHIMCYEKIKEFIFHLLTSSKK